MRLRVLLRVFLSINESSRAGRPVASFPHSFHDINELFLGRSHRVRLDLFDFIYLLQTNLQWRDSLLHSLRVVVKSLILRPIIMKLPDWRESINIRVGFHHCVNFALYLFDAFRINDYW